MEYKILESLTRSLMTSRILKTTTQLLLISVSLCCYIFYHSSCCSFLLHSLKFYVSALIPLHSLDKRWMFLICNGILVVLANTSGLVLSPSGLDHNDHIQNKIRDDHRYTSPAVDSKDEVFLEEEAQVLLRLESAEQVGNAVSDENDEIIDQEVLITGEKDQEAGSQDDHQCCCEEEQGDNDLSMTMEDHEEQLEPSLECGLLKMEGGGGEGEPEAEDIKIYIKRDDEEHENYSEDGFDLLEEEEEEMEAVQGEEDEGLILEKLSAEELNKKFEDFIRKMKDELRIEAQQHHLVAVK